jgi:formylglycine-generating enzyme required for sulfatase activity
MHDLPRQKLSELLAKHGPALCDDAKKLEGLLKDVLRNEHKRETFALVSALREGVAHELRSSTSGMPPAALAAKLVRQLCDNLGLDDGVARWSVESWAVALGVGIAVPPAALAIGITLPPAAPVNPVAKLNTTGPTTGTSAGVDLVALAMQHRAKADQAKAHAAQVQKHAKELAEQTQDFATAARMIEEIEPQWRDAKLYERICGCRDQVKADQCKAHATQVQKQAEEMAEETRDFATAARMMEEIEPQWRDAKLYEKICGHRDKVKRLDAGIQDAVQKGRLRFLRGSVQELLKLQPQRDDMRRLLDVLPEEPELAKEFTNSIGMRFVLIQPGEFMMGSKEADNEKPPHLVRIARPFYLGVFPVTQAEYQAVTGQTPSHEGNPSHPVGHVSWDDAVACAQMLSQRSAETSRQLTYRLPTEAEWEYACRAGSTGKWCFGDVESQLGNYAWFTGNSGNQTHPVGQKKPNAWGLHDMHGNVWEWCLDGYNASYYKASPTVDPPGPSPEACGPGGSYRVLRGGSSGRSRAGNFSHDSSSSRSAYRYGLPSRFRIFHLGFRLALVPE